MTAFHRFTAVIERLTALRPGPKIVRSTFISLAVGCAGGAFADELPLSPPADDAGWTLTQSIVSDYFFRGVRLAEASFEPQLEYQRAAWSAGTWSNVALTHIGNPANPEIDFYGSYRIPTGAKTDLTPGFTLYVYPRAHRSDGAHPLTFEPNLAASFDIHGVRLTPKLYYDFVLEGATGEVNAAVAFALPSLGTELDVNLTVGTFRFASATAGSPREKNWGDYAAIDLSVPYRIGPRSTLSVQIGYAAGTNNYFKSAGLPKRANPDAISRAIISLAYSRSL